MTRASRLVQRALDRSKVEVISYQVSVQTSADWFSRNPASYIGLAIARHAASRPGFLRDITCSMYFQTLTVLFASLFISISAVPHVPAPPFTPPPVPSLSSILAYVATHRSSGACCAGLTYVLGADKVGFPGSVSYTGTLSQYWSLQESAVLPKCVVQPANTKDVSKAVYVLSVLGKRCGFKDECKFAIKSGGHTPFEGAANQQGGVTIDMVKLVDVKVNTDQTIVKVGSGNR